MTVCNYYFFTYTGEKKIGITAVLNTYKLFFMLNIYY